MLLSGNKCIVTFFVDDKDVENGSTHCPIVADSPHPEVTHIIITLEVEDLEEQPVESLINVFL